jgi:branched-chain amino acid transport system ATP-binding protein
VQQIGRTIERLKKDGFTILLVEQNFRFAQTVADRHYIVQEGRVVEMFTYDEIDSSLNKLHAYLGV